MTQLWSTVHKRAVQKSERAGEALTSKDGGDAEVGCYIVQHQAALGIPTDGHLAAALQEGSAGNGGAVGILQGFHCLPPGALELPQYYLATCMPCQ